MKQTMIYLPRWMAQQMGEEEWKICAAEDVRVTCYDDDGGLLPGGQQRIVSGCGRITFDPAKKQIIHH